MKRLFVLMFLMSLSTAAAVFAADPPKDRTVTGPIVMIFKPQKKIEVRTPDNHLLDAVIDGKTKITLDGKPATFADLTTKQTATVAVVDGTKAVSIDAKSPEPK